MIWFLCGNTGKNANLLKIDLISSTNRIYTNLCTPLRYIRSILLDEFIEIVKPLAELSNSIKNFNTSMCMVLIQMSESTDQKRERKNEHGQQHKSGNKNGKELTWKIMLCPENHNKSASSCLNFICAKKAHQVNTEHTLTRKYNDYMTNGAKTICCLPLPSPPPPSPPSSKRKLSPTDQRAARP